jgi:hypothetical protein
MKAITDKEWEEFRLSHASLTQPAPEIARLDEDTESPCSMKRKRGMKRKSRSC